MINLCLKLAGTTRLELATFPLEQAGRSYLYWTTPYCWIFQLRIQCICCFFVVWLH